MANSSPSLLEASTGAVLAAAVFVAAAALISLRTVNAREDAIQVGHSAQTRHTPITPNPCSVSVGG